MRTCKYMMRINEIQPLKHIMPLNPAHARIYRLKAEIDKSRTALKTERDSQRRAKDLQQRRKQQGQQHQHMAQRAHTANGKQI